MDTNLISNLKWGAEEEPKNISELIEQRLLQFRGVSKPLYYRRCHDYLERFSRITPLNDEDRKYVMALMDCYRVDYNMYEFRNAAVNNPLTDRDLDRVDAVRQRRVRGP